MFGEPQINYYVHDVEAMTRFYVDTFEFVETFRYEHQGVAAHTEVRLVGLVLGFASYEAARRDHSLDVTPGPRQAELVLWTDDLDAALARCEAVGTRRLSEPHVFIGHLRGAWVADPEGGHVHLVQDLRTHPR